jgi:pectate lyase
MKFTILKALAFAAAASARAIVKRSDASEVASVGYATLNGGTTGGAGGSTVSVSTLSDLQDAASADGSAIIIVTAPIEGDGIIHVASDKTIVGVDSSVSE